jgi:zinc protease
MKPFRRKLGAWVLALAATSLAGAARAQEDQPVHSRTLANGLEVIVVESHAVPIVTIELDVKNGAYTQTPEFEGLAHLYEHMFFKANRTIPSQEKYLERLRQLGAQWNGTTSEERVNYFITLGVDSIEGGMQFMEDAIRYPLFLEDELVRERPVVTGEYDRVESNPSFHLQRGIDTLLWSPAYYSRKNAIGVRSVILTTTPEKMRTIQQLYYVPNNSALILSGDVTPAQGFALAEKVFGDWPRGANPFATPVPDPPPLATSKAVIIEQPVQTVTVQVEWQGPSVTKDARSTYVADVLTEALSNPTSAFQKALVESGLAFSASFGYYTQAHVGPIYISAQTTPEKALAVHRAILDEVNKMSQPGYITDEQLASAKTQARIGEEYQREQASTLAHSVGFWWAVKDLNYYLDYVEDLGSVTGSDFATLARSYMIGHPRVSGVLISPEARQQIGLTVQQLLNAGMTP